MWANIGLLLTANANAHQQALTTNMINSSLRPKRKQNARPVTQPVGQQSGAVRRTRVMGKKSTISTVRRQTTAPKTCGWYQGRPTVQRKRTQGAGGVAAIEARGAYDGRKETHNF